MLDSFLYKCVVDPIAKHVNEAIASVVKLGRQVGKTAKNGNKCFKLNDSWGHQYFATIDKDGRGLRLMQRGELLNNGRSIHAVSIGPGQYTDYSLKECVNTLIKPGDKVVRRVIPYKHGLPTAHCKVRTYNFETGSVSVKRPRCQAL